MTAIAATREASHRSPRVWTWGANLRQQPLIAPVALAFLRDGRVEMRQPLQAVSLVFGFCLMPVVFECALSPTTSAKTYIAPPATAWRSSSAAPNADGGPTGSFGHMALHPHLPHLPVALDKAHLIPGPLRVTPPLFPACHGPSSPAPTPLAAAKSPSGPPSLGFVGPLQRAQIGQLHLPNVIPKARYEVRDEAATGASV